MVRFGVFEADLAGGELRRGGNPVKLQDQPFRLLVLLLEHPGAIVTREEVRAALWPDGNIVDFDYGVNTAIKKVRCALDDSADNPRFVQTLPRKGYRFIAPVFPEASLTAPAPATAPSIAPSTKLPWTWMIAASLAALSVPALWLVRHRPAPSSAGSPVPLTAYPGSEWGAAFSPDNRRVAFAWNGVDQDNYDIYVKTAGVESPTRLTTDHGPDLSPAWSPDGRRIAFLRGLGGCRVGLMIVPAAGGPEVKIAEVLHPRVWGHFETNDCLPSDYRNLAFSRDGNWLITSDREAGAPGQYSPRTGLVLFSVADGSRRPLTLPPPTDAVDMNPAVSPDGRTVAFIRGPDRSSELFVLALDSSLSPSGEPRRLTSWKRFTANPAWTTDGREIIVASGEFEKTRLWRVPWSGGAETSAITSAGDFATLPAFAPDGRLAFTHTGWNLSIWALDLSASPNISSKLRPWPASSSLRDSSPRFSPDGRHVVFVSNRSGAYEVWMANADGSSTLQLTSISAPFAGSPSWSPDGSTVLFDATNKGRFEVYAIKAAGGTPRRMMGSSGEDDAVASFSADGRWIYFASNRTGEFQIWRMPATGGRAVQWTRRGGHVSRESQDGRYLYFAKVPQDRPASLWRMPANGGEEAQVLESVWAYAWEVAKRGIYYEVPPGNDGHRAMFFHSFATGRTSQFADGGMRPGEGIAVSPDEMTLLRGQSTGIGADLMLLKDFR
jgi:Tol biopolymer transport system component/DNA-binding winged helix-turn-helix (wHTH) protein